MAIRAYAALGVQRAQVALTYRLSLATGILTGLVRILVLYYIWRVVYQGESVLQGFTLQEMTTYLFVSFVLRNFYSFQTETSISSKIRDGSVSFELIKPLNYQMARFAESLGSVVVEGVLIGIVVATVGWIAFGMSGPATPVAAAAFVASLVLSLMINFAICFLVGLVSFWSTSVFGIVNSKRLIVEFFSGALVPLAFFPAWLRTIAQWLPFRGIVSTPVIIYLGQVSGERMWAELAVQAAWIVVMWLAGAAVWRLATRRLEVNGG